MDYLFKFLEHLGGSVGHLAEIAPINVAVRIEGSWPESLDQLIPGVFQRPVSQRVHIQDLEASCGQCGRRGVLPRTVRAGEAYEERRPRGAQCMAPQEEPFSTDTRSGTLSRTAPSISARTRCISASASDSGTSKMSSSCTCRSSLAW